MNDELKKIKKACQEFNRDHSVDSGMSPETAMYYGVHHGFEAAVGALRGSHCFTDTEHNIRNEKLQEEIEQLKYKLESLLCHATGGKGSIAADLESMKSVVTEYIESEICDALDHQYG